MNDSNKIKQLLKPTMVVQHYLGLPIRSNRLGNWYKSPFRDERTASFCVSDIKGIHDFGTSEHYDIISFVQELFKIDFKTSVMKLHNDFGIIDSGQSSRELKVYLITRKDEELQIRRNLNSWFNKTYDKLCTQYQIWHKITKKVKKDALVIAYDKECKLEYLTEIFINAKDENDKLMLWKDKEKIEKII